MSTSSVLHIEQQVERVMQSIANQLFDYINQQVGRLETIVSKNTSLNDDRQITVKLIDFILYQLHRMCQDILIDVSDFTLNPLNSVFLVGRRYQGNMRSALTDGS